MSEYIEQVKEILRPELGKYGLKILPRGKNAFSLVRGSSIVMTVRDTPEQVEVSYKGKKYNYDKWYTKPEHLAAMILNVLEVQEKQV